jgi:hypothetical protein
VSQLAFTCAQVLDTADKQALLIPEVMLILPQRYQVGGISPFSKASQAAATASLHVCSLLWPFSFPLATARAVQLSPAARVLSAAGAMPP